MPCTIRVNESVARAKDAELRLKELEKQLKEKSARIVRVGNKVSIKGWDNRGGWCDACAIRQLKLSTDFQVRQVVNSEVKDGEVLTFDNGH